MLVDVVDNKKFIYNIYKYLQNNFPFVSAYCIVFQWFALQYLQIYKYLQVFARNFCGFRQSGTKKRPVSKMETGRGWLWKAFFSQNALVAPSSSLRYISWISSWVIHSEARKV